MKSYKACLLIILSLSLLSACQSIPPGTPPEGPIVTIDIDQRALLTEDQAVEKMVTAFASSEPLITSSEKLNMILGKTVVQNDFFREATSLSSRVYRELINTGLADYSQNKEKEYTLSSTFVKIKSLPDDQTEFRWNMYLLRQGMSDPDYTCSVSVAITKNTQNILEGIKPESISPLYK